jgi:hypothetical protein
MRPGTLLLAGALSAGCYSYTPLVAPVPEPGTSIAATLTDSGSLALTRYLGPAVSVVRGRYVGTSDAGLQIAVSSVLLDGGGELPWAGETVTLPGGTVQSLQLRRLSKGRSVLFAGLGVAGVAATVAAFDLIGTGTASTGTGGPPGHQ